MKKPSATQSTRSQPGAAKAGDVEIVNYVAPTAGMVAYLASREGAQRFLSRSQVFRRIDEDTKYYWELGLPVTIVKLLLVRGVLVGIMAYVFIPAALGGMIHEDNADLLNCKMIVEGANMPVTPEADIILDEQDAWLGR